MKHFLVQDNDQLVFLPDFFLEVGKRPIQEIRQLGGPPVFMEGRKQPDLCTFRLPSGAVIRNGYCSIADETGVIRSVRAASTEIAAFQFIVAGLVEDVEDLSDNPDAMALIAHAASAVS